MLVLMPVSASNLFFMSSQQTAQTDLSLNHLVLFLEDYQADRSARLPSEAFEEVRQLIAFFLNEVRFEEEAFRLKKELKARDAQIKELSSCINLLRDDLAEALSAGPPGLGSGLPDSDEKPAARRVPASHASTDASLKAKALQVELAADLSQEHSEQQVIGRNVLSKLSKKIKSNEQHLREELEKVRREALEDLEALRERLKEVEHEKGQLEAKLRDQEDAAKDRIEGLVQGLEERYPRLTQRGPHRADGEAAVEAHGVLARARRRKRGQELRGREPAVQPRAAV